MVEKDSRSSEFDFGLIFIWIWLLIVILVPILPARASGPCYPVLRVVDGDTISILYQGEKEKIRLLNVDTPACRYYSCKHCTRNF